ncbi:MAG TPA: DUF6537 domain-containing protein, partial [Acetobacteraceae bacterium]|nr:DUF6537 domain-containing protein [Acetobacteraceae bacterium]
VVPVETEFGRKRAIDQSSCNKDFSCVDGFCPSFVTVHGGRLRKPEAALVAPDDLPEPVLPSGEHWNMLIAGIGGTGVVTAGALLGMAAHLEGRPVSVLDVTGLAQKGGAVISHIRLGSGAGSAQSHRVPAGEADLLLGCDVLVTGGAEALDTLGEGRSFAVLNLHETITGAFIRNPDMSLPVRQIRRVIESRIGAGRVAALDVTALAAALLGDAIATNPFLLGHAWQLGKIPLSRASIEQAIRLNGQAVEMNLAAFAWGRAAAHDPKRIEARARARLPEPVPQTADLDALISRCRDDLVAYQDARYAGRFMELVAAVRAAEAAARPESHELTEAVARNFHKLMAYKDEYEVARLYARPEFRRALEARFEGDYSLRFHLAPPWLGGHGGHSRKREFGIWMLPAFRILARLRPLRGTRFDPFGHTEERRSERALITRYESSIRTLLPRLARLNFEDVLALARLPGRIRGFGHVKEASLRAAEPEWRRLEAALAAEPLDEVPRLAAE